MGGNNSIIGNHVSNFTFGIALYDGINNTFENNTLYNNFIGIYAIYSINNSFNGDTVSSYIFDFYAENETINITANNMTLSSYPTTISFRYGYGIALKGINESEFHPNDGLVPINKFVNITRLSPNSWINITFWYEDSDVASVNEDSLALYEWNGSSWNEVPFILNESRNCINANITGFSIYGIFGNLTYTLHKGWNLITVPINVTWHARDLASFINQQYGGAICTTIVTFVHNSHIGWVAPMPDLNNFTIYPGIGYWVFVEENVTLNWHGELASVDINLHTGYNLIGWTTVEKGNASIALHKIKNASMVITWNEITSKYEIYMKTMWGYHGDNFALPVGRGFYVYCTASDKWYGS